MPYPAELHEQLELLLRLQRELWAAGFSIDESHTGALVRLTLRHQKLFIAAVEIPDFETEEPRNDDDYRRCCAFLMACKVLLISILEFRPK